MKLNDELSQELVQLKLEVYSTPWCGDCHRLKHWLNANEVPYQEVDIDEDREKAEELVEQTGKRAIPFIKVNGSRFVRGYHKELPVRFDPELLVSELKEAAAS